VARRPQGPLNNNTVLSTVAVCDGQDHLGNIEQRGDGFHAIAITGERLGVFKTMPLAMRAFPVRRAS